MSESDRLIWCRECRRYSTGRVCKGRDVVALHYDRAGGLCSGSGRAWSTVCELAEVDWHPGAGSTPDRAPATVRADVAGQGYED